MDRRAFVAFRVQRSGRVCIVRICIDIQPVSISKMQIMSAPLESRAESQRVRYHKVVPSSRFMMQSCLCKSADKWGRSLTTLRRNAAWKMIHRNFLTKKRTLFGQRKVWNKSFFELPALIERSSLAQELPQQLILRFVRILNHFLFLCHSAHLSACCSFDTSATAPRRKMAIYW